MPTSSIHERLLKVLNDSAELTYLIAPLNETKINNYAEAGILIFILAYCHPSILNTTQFPPLQKLCQDCFIHATPNQLYAVVNRPENTKVKILFDQFVEHTLAATQKEKPVPGGSCRGIPRGCPLFLHPPCHHPKSIS